MYTGSVNATVYFYGSVLVLAAMLFLPVSRLVWTLSVRRLQRRTGTAPDDAQSRGQLVRARFIAALLCLAFSFLFNLNLLGSPGHG